MMELGGERLSSQVETMKDTSDIQVRHSNFRDTNNGIRIGIYCNKNSTQTKRPKTTPETLQSIPV